MEVKNISVYWNSMSQMYIPTSVWESANQFKYGVFELIDADTIHGMMKDVFEHGIGMENNYFIDPFSLRIQFGFRNSYDPNTDEYKYRISVVNDKVRVNVKPETLVDLMYFNQYMEG